MTEDDIPGNYFDVEAGVLNIAPGQQFELTMNILDMDGHSYTNEESAIASLDFSRNQQITPNSVIFGRDSIAKSGNFTFSNLLIKMQPSSTAMVTIVIHNLDVYQNNVPIVRTG